MRVLGAGQERRQERARVKGGDAQDRQNAGILEEKHADFLAISLPPPSELLEGSTPSSSPITAHPVVWLLSHI